LISATGNITTASGGSIGVGTSTPDSDVTILGYPQTVSYALTGNSATLGTDLHISGADGGNTRITQDAFGTGSYVAFTGRTARGTAASPTQTQSSDILTQFTARGFSNGSLQFGNVSTGRVDFVAAENFTDTSRATNVQIYTTATGAITPTALATFSSASGLSVTGNVTGGNLITGALAQAATLSATGAVTFSATTDSIGIGNSHTTGAVIIGGSSGTGNINLGRSTASQNTNIQIGATGTGNTKTINIGTGGLAGSTTTIAIGPVTATTAAATATFNTATTVAIGNTGGSALSVAGNITGGNVLGGANVNATTHTGTTVSVTGNITGGNVLFGSGIVSGTGNITGGPYLKTSSLTVATLPAASTAGAGARSFVTDATSTTFASIVAGAGANAVPVFSDGTNWKIG
jgi:hypothetical protein